MPIYEYLCEKCNLKFEILQRNSEGQTEVCPQCGTPGSRRLFSVFGFSLGGKFGSSSSKGTACSTCHRSSCDSCG